MSIDDALTHLPPILGAIIFGTFELIVAFSKTKTRVKRIFQIYLLAMFLWSVSALMTLSGRVEVLGWFRIMTIAPIIMTIAIFYFVQTLFWPSSKMGSPCFCVWHCLNSLEFIYSVLN